MYVFNKFSYKTTSSNDFFFELVSIAHVYGLTKYAVRSNQQPSPPHTHTHTLTNQLIIKNKKDPP